MHEFLSICAQDGSHLNTAGATAAYSHRVYNILDCAGGTCAAPVAGQADTQFKATMDALGSMRPAESIPVYVMLPLDTVNADGVFRYAYIPWFAQALQVLALSGVHGVAVDVWWCAVERSPGHYSWTGYKQLFEMVRSKGLKLQVVLSFHACGGNVGDLAQVPLPPWVLEAGQQDPDIFFTDRPRDSGLGQRNKEYISIWADDCPCYGGVMRAFRDEFRGELGSLIEEVVVGSGPCGELRYPSYVEANGWRFPGVGSWDSDYGSFFLNWYSRCLLQHGERLVQLADEVFGPFKQEPRQDSSPLAQAQAIAGVHWWYNSTSHASELTAGYYNTHTRDGYSPILEMCEKYGVNLTLTCVEMCDAQHPSYALCGPEGLLRQIRLMAAKRQVSLSGENALPIFTVGGVDAVALDRVVTNHASAGTALDGQRGNVQVWRECSSSGFSSAGRALRGMSAASVPEDLH
eukprot:gene7368-7578_t